MVKKQTAAGLNENAVQLVTGGEWEPCVASLWCEQVPCADLTCSKQYVYIAKPIHTKISKET